MHHGESVFILYSFPFFLTGEQKVRNHWRGVNILYSLYLLRHANGQIHMYLIASLLTSAMFCCVRIQVTRMVHVETYMHVLGLWFASTAAAKIIIKHVFLIHITNCEICNILCLNKCDCLSKNPTCSHTNWNSFYCPSL